MKVRMVVVAIVSVTVFLVLGVFGATYTVRQMSSPERAAAALADAVAAQDDAAVYGSLSPEARSSVCSDSVDGAAERFARLSSNVASYTLVTKADDQVWLVQPDDNRYRVEMSAAGGWPIREWKVDCIRCVRQEEINSVIGASKKWEETRHLAKGVKVVTLKPKNGERVDRYDVLLNNGVEERRQAVDGWVRTEAVDGIGWKGTGTKSSKAKTVTNVKIGTKVNKKKYVVTNPKSTLDASDGQVFVSWRVNGRPRGKLRVVLLGPQDTKYVLGNQKLGGDWCIGYSGTTDPSGSFGPEGTWVAVVERDGKPAVWKKFKIE